MPLAPPSPFPPFHNDRFQDETLLFHTQPIFDPSLVDLGEGEQWGDSFGEFDSPVTQRRAIEDCNAWEAIYEQEVYTGYGERGVEMETEADAEQKLEGSGKSRKSRTGKSLAVTVTTSPAKARVQSSRPTTPTRTTTQATSSCATVATTVVPQTTATTPARTIPISSAKAMTPTKTAVSTLCRAISPAATTVISEPVTTKTKTPIPVSQVAQTPAPVAVPHPSSISINQASTPPTKQSTNRRVLRSTRKPSNQVEVSLPPSTSVSAVKISTPRDETTALARYLVKHRRAQEQEQQVLARATASAVEMTGASASASAMGGEDVFGQTERFIPSASSSGSGSTTRSSSQQPPAIVSTVAIEDVAGEKQEAECEVVDPPRTSVSASISRLEHITLKSITPTHRMTAPQPTSSSSSRIQPSPLPHRQQPSPFLQAAQRESPGGSVKRSVKKRRLSSMELELEDGENDRRRRRRLASLERELPLSIAMGSGSGDVFETEGVYPALPAEATSTVIEAEAVMEVMTVDKNPTPTPTPATATPQTKINRRKSLTATVTTFLANLITRTPTPAVETPQRPVEVEARAATAREEINPLPRRRDGATQPTATVAAATTRFVQPAESSHRAASVQKEVKVSRVEKRKRREEGPPRVTRIRLFGPENKPERSSRVTRPVGHTPSAPKPVVAAPLRHAPTGVSQPAAAPSRAFERRPWREAAQAMGSQKAPSQSHPIISAPLKSAAARDVPIAPRPLPVRLVQAPPRLTANLPRASASTAAFKAPSSIPAVLTKPKPFTFTASRERETTREPSARSERGPVSIKPHERAKDLASRRALFENLAAKRLGSGVGKQLTIPEAGRTPGRIIRQRIEERQKFESGLKMREEERRKVREAEERERLRFEAIEDAQRRKDTIVWANPVPDMYRRSAE